MVYEMSFDVSQCGNDDVYVGIPTAHNSPAKDDKSDVPITPTVVYTPTPSTAAHVGDFVWHDLFHSQSHQIDGIQDAGEPGIAGVIMELYDSSHTLVVTTTTDTNGHYLFSDLLPGTYTVRVADSNFASGGVLEGWYASPKDRGSDDTKDSDGHESTHEASVTLSSGEQNDTMDFGFFRTGIALEKTGPQSVHAGEVITYHFMVTNTGDLILHTGAHVYDPLINPDGDHEIWTDVVKPEQVVTFTRTYTPSVGQCDPIPNTATALGHPKHPDGYYVTDVTDQDSWTVQVICNTASLGDYVWHDGNADGIQDTGEQGIPDVTVKLYDSSHTLITTTTTDATGHYTFTNLAAGDYYIEFVPPAGYAFSPKDQGGDDTKDSDAEPTTGRTEQITLGVGQSDMTWDAGLYQPDITLSKEVEDLPGNVVLVGQTVSFTIQITNTGDSTLIYIPLDDEYDDTCLQYIPKSANPEENQRQTGLIRWLDLTLSFGHDLQPGQRFTVTVPFYAAAPDDDAWNRAVVSGAADIYSQVLPPADAEVSVICREPASIGDYVWNDANGNGLQDEGAGYGINGVTLYLYQDDGDGVFEPGGEDGSPLKTAVTSGDGGYDFTMLHAGSYWVDVDESTLAPGYELVAGTEPHLATVDYGDDYNDADFGYAGRGTISGIVWYDWNENGVQDLGEDGIAGVEVCLYYDDGSTPGVLDPGDTPTGLCEISGSPDGDYSFPGQLPGDYLVVETQPPGLESTTPNVIPVHLVVVGPSGNAPDKNFGEVAFASLGNYAWIDSICSPSCGTLDPGEWDDLNSNGEQDPGEPGGIPNVQITVDGTDVLGQPVHIITYTDYNGYYLVDELIPGTYV
ncbi:MAG TPA: hypothetical protein EYP04_04220, partial [Anaerolineae bacterium]|nr:hypothetical protein [Anaerolineae bacterium]